MKTAVYFCNCGTNVSDKINPSAVESKVKERNGDVYFKAVNFLCSEEGKEFLKRDIEENSIEAVVIPACSPRDHEKTFMNVLSSAGLNPYMMQMVNIREQVAWVTEDSGRAVLKATHYINAALSRVGLQEPLEKRELEVCLDAVVVGAGPAGIKAAMSLAEAGRKVTVIEKSPVLGGLPVRYEEIFPNMECGPCMLEPIMGDALHGDASENIEFLTLSDMKEVVGSYGNFTVKAVSRPRYIDIDKCIGCAECIAPCPVSIKNPFNYGLSEKKAIDFAFAGGLPNVPYIDDASCLRFKGDSCRLCVEACPVGEDVFNFEEKETVRERTAGSIILAVGASIYDCGKIPSLGYGNVSGVYNSLEFERMLASNGPFEGSPVMPGGVEPQSFAIVHCAGSLDKNHNPYCSGICCSYAFKFNHIIRAKFPSAAIFHLYKEMVVPGKEGSNLYKHAVSDKNTFFIRINDINNMSVRENEGKKIFSSPVSKSDADAVKDISADMVVLCPAVVPNENMDSIAEMLEVVRDKNGFFEELHGRTDAGKSKIKGVYLTGSCHAPMDIKEAMSEGMAATGYILSGLVQGRKLTIDPITAVVNADKCSGCKTCLSVCPYKAIYFDDKENVSSVNELLCQGCGTCVAACPSSAIKANQFTDQEIFSEISEMLA